MPQKVDAEKIKKAIRSSQPLAIKTFTLPHETEVFLEQVLGHFLDEFGMGQIKDQLAYCMRELAVNAKKANTKRVYFEEKNLELDNKKDYSEGMQNFKEDTLSNIDYYLNKQKEKGYYIKILFQAKGKEFVLSVHNNVEMTRKEQMRVYDRIARSRAFESMEEAFSTVLDDSEGAGLGLVILILMLRKLGLTEDSFEIDTEKGETVARITVPFSEVRLESLDILSNKIVDEIDKLPQFPDNIVQVQKLISDPDSEIIDIARHISTDVSLTADLLKVVNSAQFMLPKRVDNIVEAVKYVGLRGIKNLLYSYGTQKILTEGTAELWEHSYRTAFYAYTLARNLRKKDLLDDTYVGGILHDIGKIVFSNIHPHLLEKIAEFCKERGINKDLFEDLSAGLNHAEIGAMIAEKWNFPDSLVEAIKFHHDPTHCSQEYRDVVYSVYLANAVCNVEEGQVTFDLIERQPLSLFRISTEEQFLSIQERLGKAFEKERVKQERQREEKPES